MRNANHLPWTEDKASAATVALGPLNAPTWTAATPVNVALAAEVGQKSTALAAYANHGRWVVACPDCNGAQFACPDDQRFMCNECANVAVSGLWRPVVWPKDRIKIEALLSARPESAKNWEPGETLAFLRAENKTHGVS